MLSVSEKVVDLDIFQNGFNCLEKMTPKGDFGSSLH